MWWRGNETFRKKKINQQNDVRLMNPFTYYRLCLFCPFALFDVPPSIELLLGFVSESGGSFRFSI